jgi:hypothetical protein
LSIQDKFIFILIVTIASSCSPAPNSEIKSLSALVFGDNEESLPVCKGNYSVHPKANKSLREPFSAVPYEIQKTFFEDFKGRIELHNNLTTCGSKPSNTPYQGCYVVQNTSGKSELVMHFNKNNANKNLVRLFGVFTSRMLSQRKIPSTPGGSVIFNKSFSQGWNIKDLALSFILELRSLDLTSANLEQIGHKFGFTKEFARQVLAQNSRKQIVSNYNNYVGNGKLKVELAVFEESFDGYYCHPAKTRTRMARDFPNTYGKFALMANDIEPRNGPDRFALSSASTGFFNDNREMIEKRRTFNEDLGLREIRSSSDSLSLGMDLNVTVVLMRLLQAVMSGSGGLGSLFSGGGLGSLPGSGTPPPTTTVPNPGAGRQPTTPPTKSTPTTPSSDIDNDVNVAEYMTKFNAYRKSHGLASMEFSNKLTSDASKNNPHQLRNKRSGHFVAVTGAEIAFYGPSTIDAAINGWHNSAGHRKLMQGSYNCTGIHRQGIAWTQRFSNSANCRD